MPLKLDVVLIGGISVATVIQWAMKHIKKDQSAERRTAAAYIGSNVLFESILLMALTR